MSLAAHPLIADWITVKDGRLMVHTGKVDIGQRISTALVQIAHEELGLAPDQISVAPVRTGHAPNEGMTSGSNSIEQSGQALRCAAATLRVLVIGRAVSRYGGAPEDWHLDAGELYLLGTNHRINLLDLAGDIPADAKVNPDSPLRVLPDDAAPKPAMLGLPDMVRGSYSFVHDLDVPGMRHARVIRPPHANARLIQIPDSSQQHLQAAGLHLTCDGSFLALSGPQEWPVVEAAAKLTATCVWDRRGGLPEDDVFAKLASEDARRFLVVDGTPTDSPIPAEIEQPDFSARYERPYQMHGSLAPSAALALWQDGLLTIHSQSQGIYALRDSIADSLGLEVSQVDITHVPGAGCYGHTGADDAAFEAALVALACPGEPILLKWSREDEHAWEPYASAMAVNISAKIKQGRIIEYSAEAYSDTHRGRPRPGPNRAGPAKLLANRFRADPIGPLPAAPNLGHQAGIHRNLEPIYAFPAKRLVKNLVYGLPHRTSAQRCLGGAANLFALESFMDELAFRQGTDPFTLRRAHLTEARGLKVLQELEMQVSDIPEFDGRGIAYGQYKNRMTRVAICVDIEATDRAEIQLKRATIVADAGRTIDADGLAAQLEGGFIQAASWALYEQVEWDRDGILSRDWQSYPVIRFDNVPEINITVLNRPTDKSLGAGEAVPGPAIAAIANAVFAATGIRMRRMPFSPDAILQCAYNE